MTRVELNQFNMMQSVDQFFTIIMTMREGLSKPITKLMINPQ